jgi:outer membrane protein TolC
MKIKLPIPGLTLPSIKFGDGNVYDLAATAKVPLFTGGTLAESSRASRSAYRASRQDYLTDSLKLLYDVRRAYYTAAGAQARADAALQSSQRLDRHYQDVLKAKEIGTMSDENRIQALARLRQTEQAVMTAEAAAKAARLALGNLVGQPDQQIMPTSDLQTGLGVDGDGDAIVPAQRPEVQSVNARIEQNQHLVRASQGSLWPMVSGNAVYHYAKPGIDALTNDWMNYYTVGVSATWTLWDWNSRAARIQQVKSSQRSLEARKQDLVNQLTTRRATMQENLAAARRVLDKAQDRADLERQRLALVEGRQKSGMATESDYLDAQDDLTEAETDLVTAQVQVRLAEADLLNASGY